MRDAPNLALDQFPHYHEYFHPELTLTAMMRTWATRSSRTLLIQLSPKAAMQLVVVVVTLPTAERQSVAVSVTSPTVERQLVMESVMSFSWLLTAARQLALAAAKNSWFKMGPTPTSTSSSSSSAPPSVVVPPAASPGGHPQPVRRVGKPVRVGKNDEIYIDDDGKRFKCSAYWRGSSEVNLWYQIDESGARIMCHSFKPPGITSKAWGIMAEERKLEEMVKHRDAWFSTLDVAACAPMGLLGLDMAMAAQVIAWSSKDFRLPDSPTFDESCIHSDPSASNNSVGDSCPVASGDPLDQPLQGDWVSRY